MIKEFVPYQESLELKALGFDEPCFGNWQDMKEETPWFSKSYADNQNQYYGQLCSAPTFSQAFRFFRERYGLIHDITLTTNIDNKLIGFYILIHKMNDDLVVDEDADVEVEIMNTDVDEAVLACLRKLIEIVKNK